MQTALFIAIAGALGALGRWTIGVWSHSYLGDRFAFATLFVNLAGCFLLGLLAVSYTHLTLPTKA